ncbi:Nucleotide-binding universal stress protein, UspA family [Marinobacter sp. DSM 26671]|uniref:universal stress protein n=1 Tax=Marinobacter sp. DSM 26671 TaxID=1761793 RepID=UPI0008E28F7C|nr:universal stress protein [Marinobacter sp. DSM 26671]SFE45925.1 Nucleotide-binding universal stress protein, UspA family [Marinobacter sp. DSM 26671]
MTDTRATQADAAATTGRVLVLLDGSKMSYAALQAAAEIAANTGADVLGVFVEELNQLRSAGYGFAREVGASSGISRPFTAGEVEQRMQRLANEARRALAGAVAPYGGRHTLSVARGHVIDEVLALAGPQDLLVMGRVGWSSAPGARLGSTAKGLVRRSRGRVLLWCEGRAEPLGRVVVFLNDHQEANGRAVQAAAEVIRHSHRPVTLMLGADSAIPSDDLKGVVQDLGIQESELRVRSLPSTDPVVVAGILRQERAVQLVLSRDCTLLQEPGAEQLLVALNLPVTVTP